MGNANRFLLSVSLANLLALPIWVELLHGGQRFLIDGQEYLGSILAIVILAVAIFVTSYCIHLLPTRSRDRARAALLLVSAALLAWVTIKPFVLSWLPFALGFGRIVLIVAAALVLVFAVYLLSRRAERTVKVGSAVLMVLAPFAVITFGQSLFQVYRLGLGRNTIAYPEATAPSLPAGASKTRTVVLIFDEFDYEVAFASPGDNKLLAFEQFRQTPGVFFATHAYPPNHSTRMSIPAMLTGRLVRDSAFRQDIPGDLMLTFIEGDQGPLSAQSTLFSDLRALGRTSLRMNEALLPPSRVDGQGDADFVIPAAGRRPQGVFYHIRKKLADWFAILPFSRSLLWDIKALRVLGLPHPWERKADILAQMSKLAAEADSDLLLLHVLLPHKPVVFDRSRGGLGPDADISYRDNLLATDQALDRIIKALRKAGTWESTNLVVTTDHFYRNKRDEFGVGDHRIPFMVRIAGDSSPPMTFDAPFNTVVFRAVIGAMSCSDVKTVADLAAVVKVNSTFGESPLTEYRKGW